MKGIKIYLTVAVTLLVVAIGFGVYVWYTYQELSGDIERAVGVESAPLQEPVKSDTVGARP